ncbi:glucosaminidase domain-containing protein [Aliikangiella sp. IMCC44359]|uniref:glucosaminidase domain-containing protein n=1 Tax=Aliikangiella sp. IMCC44359 TaxID=3459125 RepID=UPI00403AFC10
MSQQVNRDKSVWFVLFLTFALILIMILHHDWDKTYTKQPTQKQESLPNFSAIKSIDKRKEAFFDYLRPYIRQENQQIRYDRAFLKSLVSDFSQESHHNSSNLRKLKRLAKRYHVEVKNIDESLETLNLRIGIIPEALVLVQAANESSWGRSRFAREANNLFGQWCYKKGCGVVPNSRLAGASHEIRKFESPQASVKSYMRNLNTHHAYRNFRKLRAKLRKNDIRVTGIRLAQGLVNYSERREAYVKELIKMIKQNNLEK